MQAPRTKIVATIGPSSSDETTLTNMIQAGMNIARLNFSHGSHENHADIYKKLRELSRRLEKPLAIMQDLQGVKIRVGDLPSPMTLKSKEEVTITSGQTSREGKIPVDFPDLHEHLKPGSKILLDDGNMELQVNEVEDEDIKCSVEIGGVLKSNKGINLPGTKLEIPGFTEKDKEDLEFGLELGVDAVAVSFVSNAEDIARVKLAINQKMKNTRSPLIIAKLERPEALENLDEIVDISDGVMVARGDLGVEMSPEAVPIIQKRIIETANLNKKIVITATQMLESMISNPRPTRAEANDVANAIFDGTDAVMLSGETAVGAYPVETISMMHAIIVKSEEHLKQWGRWQGTPTKLYEDDSIAITGAARELAHDLNVAAIVVFTQSGRTARYMSKAMPRVPIIGFTPDEITYRRMAFYWGVHPNKIQFANTLEEMLTYVESAMIAKTPIKDGQQVVVICGFPVGGNRLPNLALLHTIGTQT
ncbi:MAG: pyruvate kinase [candidate division Zixibacteria bacterium]|nr:pyruvate kinase [Gammaproteobacteria bacterium]NIX55839.1 pyruvate kinase [candidate division Zixibacteria bacterium]